METPSRKLNRREFVKRGIAAGATAALSPRLGRAADLLSLREVPQSADIPQCLSQSFTRDVEKVNKETFPIQRVAPIEGADRQSRGLALLTQGKDGSVVMTQYFDAQMNAYSPYIEQGTVPMQKCTSPIALAGKDIEDRTTFVAGGVDFDKKSNSIQHPRLYISRNDGKSFDQSVTLRNENGKELTGFVEDIQRIPGMDKAIVTVSSAGETFKTHGVLDIAEGRFDAIKGATEDLPLIDDFVVDPANPSRLLISGRVIKNIDGGTKYTAGLTDFTLDLETNEVIEMTPHHTDLKLKDEDPFPVLLGRLRVLRDEKGRPVTGYAAQTIQSGLDDFAKVRNFFQIDMQSADYHYLFYGGFLDGVVKNLIEPDSPSDEMIIQQGLNTILTSVRAVPRGIWTTGTYISKIGNRPLAIFWPSDLRQEITAEMIQVYPFDDVMKLPSPVAQDPVFLTFFDPTGQEPNGIHGIVLNILTEGAVFIRTDENFTPLTKEPIYITNNASPDSKVA